MTKETWLVSALTIACNSQEGLMIPALSDIGEVRCCDLTFSLAPEYFAFDLKNGFVIQLVCMAMG